MELVVKVSLRGASAKEITRDALLQKVTQERELRNYAKRAAAAALFIQVLSISFILKVNTPLGRWNTVNSKHYVALQAHSMRKLNLSLSSRTIYLHQ